MAKIIDFDAHRQTNESGPAWLTDERVMKIGDGLVRFVVAGLLDNLQVDQTTLDFVRPAKGAYSFDHSLADTTHKRWRLLLVRDVRVNMQRILGKEPVSLTLSGPTKHTAMTITATYRK